MENFIDEKVNLLADELNCIINKLFRERKVTGSQSFNIAALVVSNIIVNVSYSSSKGFDGFSDFNLKITKDEFLKNFEFAWQQAVHLAQNMDFTVDGQELLKNLNNH